MAKYTFTDFVKGVISMEEIKKTVKVTKLFYFKLIVDKVLIPEILRNSYIYAKEIAKILKKRGLKYFAINVLGRGHLDATNASIGLPYTENRTISVKVLTELGYQSFESAYGEMNKIAENFLRNYDKDIKIIRG